jgi:DNA-binding XRE family transcriptional regulator
VVILNNRIRQLREEKSMTQMRLSSEIGVTQETVSAYEIGRHRPSLKSLIIMSKLFESSIDYILGLSDIRNNTIKASDLSNDEIKLLRTFRKMSVSQKERVRAYIDGVISGT